MTIVKGSVRRITIGHKTALMSAIAARRARLLEGECVGRRQQRGDRHERQSLDPEQDHRPDREPQEPPPTARASSRVPLDRLPDSSRCYLLAHGRWRGSGRVARARSADRIVFLGHATVLIELDGVRLLTDPLLRSARRASAPPGPAGRQDADPRPGCRADLTPAPRSPRPRLVAAARSRHCRCSCRPAPERGCARQGFGTVSELAVGERRGWCA